MKTAIMVGVLTVGFVTSVAAQDIRVQVVKAEAAGPFVSKDTKPKDLDDSVEDVLKQFRDHRKGIVVVDEQPDIIVEVVRRGYLETGDESTTYTSAGRFGSKARSETTADKDQGILVRMVVGDYTEEFFGSAPGVLFGIWKQCAVSVTKQIEEWVTLNHDALIELREEQ